MAIDTIFQTHEDNIHLTISPLNDTARQLLSTIEVGRLENGVLVLSEDECDAAFEVIDAAGLKNEVLA